MRTTRTTRGKRFLALLLTLVMLLGVFPMQVLADSGETNAETPIGTVTVIVENNTAKPAPNSTGDGYWSDDVADTDKWYGVLLNNAEVPLYESSTAMSCVIDALKTEGIGYTAASSYISVINGLESGWMATVDDWFSSATLDQVTYKNKMLISGSVIDVVYTCTGSDIGGDPYDDTKTLKALSVTGAELNPSFDAGTTEYELVIGDKESCDISLTPTATNKNFVVGTYKSAIDLTAAKALENNTWYTDTGIGLVRRGQTVNVKPDDTITIVVGAPNWDSMSNGSSYACSAEKTDPGIYTFKVVKTATKTEKTFDSFFTALDGIATVENNATYPMKVDTDESALVSTNGDVDSDAYGITLTFTKTAKLSFDYKASSEARYDYLKITRTTTDDTSAELNYNDRTNFSGNMTEYKTYSVEVNAGEKIALEYNKDYSGSSGDDCVWLKNFTAVLPKKVTFHSNYGTTDETAEQGIFTTANLKANTFTREGYRFKGWAETASGDVAYADGAEYTIGESDADLYAVWEKVWKVTFPNMPEGTAITLKQGDTALEVSETANTWLLPDGDYTYSAELFGYESKSDVAIKVNRADLAVPDTLTESEKLAVNFKDVPDGATIKVTHATAGTLASSSTEGTTVIYRLVPDTYSYTAKKNGCKTVHGEITVADTAQDVTVTLSAIEPWDGETVAESFADGNGTEAAPYEIESGEELAYLSKLASGSATLKSGVYYIVTNDIDLNNKAFSPIATGYKYFYGHFDGNGKTISNLYVNTASQYAGLFGNNAGEIKNVTIADAEITSTSVHVGALAGRTSGTITNCLVKNSTVSGGTTYNGNIGGLAGWCEGDVTYCAAVDTTVTGTKKVGGLIGQSEKNVKGCYTLRTNVTATGNFVGGLVGGDEECTIDSCFVRGGKVTTSGSYAGGIIGDGDEYTYSSSYYAKITNSYSTADVSSTGGDAGAIGGGTHITATNTFYNNDSAVTASGSTNVYGTAKTTAELKDIAILSSLGDEFAIYSDTDGVINAGYPYIKKAPAIAKIIPAELTAPAVSWNEKTVTWTAVEHSEGYEVTLTKGGDEVFSDTLTELTKDFSTEIDFGGTGEYTVSVIALGDGEYYSDSTAATADASFTVQSGSVTFNVTRQDNEAFVAGRMPEITVATADGKTTVALENNTAKALPLGEYTYTISAKTFVKQTGTFTLTTEGMTFNIALVYSTAWDGETTAEPSVIEGVYQISNGYELAWFRDKVNETLSAGSSCALNAVVTNDIDLGGHEWVAISKVTSTSATKGYTGTFDGQGHIISNLNPIGNEVTSYSKTELDGAGLFGYVYTGGTVKNITVSGTMQAVKYSGGVVAILAGGTVDGCTSRISITAHKDVTDAFSVGGVVGYMTNYSDKSSTVKNCRNEGTISLATVGRYVGGVVGNGSYGTGIENCANTGAVSSNTRAGGIVGNSGVPITACYNTGAVSATGDYAGGITGFVNKEVTDCYNTGAVSGAGSEYGIGGLVGQLNSEYGGKITGGYNTGAVTATGTLCGSLVGAKSDKSTVITRAYFLAGTAANAVGSNASDDDETVSATDAEFKTRGIVGLLGGNFAALDGTAYPVLKWQDENAKSVLTFILPTDAGVELTSCTTVIAAVTGEPGVYTPDDGTYNYSVTKTGYTTKNDSITMAGESQSIKIELEVLKYDVTFNVTPAGATIVVKNASDEEFSPASGTTFNLPDGKYTYTVSKFGYIAQSGSFTVSGSAPTIPAITLTGAETYAVTFTFTGEDDETVTPSAFTLKASDGTVVNPDEEGKFVYTLPDGTYTYTVSDSRFYAVEENFTVSGAAKTIPVALSVNRTWDGTTKEPAKDTDGTYLIGNAAELAWFAGQVNAGNTGYNAKLTADIYVNYGESSNTWTPIGNYSNQYSGTFDGNGKTINGLNAALFGYNGTGSLVKNVTVTGTNSGVSNVGGIANASYGSFENCINRMTVSGTSSRIGGIVGVLYEGGYIKNCANYGAVSTSYSGSNSTAHLGGIAGKSSGNVTGCFNAGTVTASSAVYGGVGGIVGEINSKTVSDCYNTGAITGSSRTAGIVGIANTASSAVANCYNVGTITTTSTNANPFCGAIVGSIADSNGSPVGTVNNCYYLENSFSYTGSGDTHNGGIGYCGSGSDSTVKKTASEMKLGSFAITLSPTDKLFNTDSGNINNGYPILTWQGGTAPVVSADEQAVAADKAALTVTPTVVTKAMTLTLPATGENGSEITWSSSNADVITADGKVTLPTTSDTAVTLTATIKKGDVTDTKEFTITVKTKVSADLALLEILKNKLGKSYRVEYMTGDNVNLKDTVKEKITSVLYSDLSGGKQLTDLSASDITVSVESAGKTTYGTGTLIADDGKITFYYADPSATGTINGDAFVGDVKLKLTMASGASVAIDDCIVSIPWDQAKVKAEMQKAVDALTFDTIKGDNTASDNVTTNLTLPQTMTGYGWATVTWESDNEETIGVSGGAAMTDFTGNVTQGSNTKNVKLTATFTFNKNSKDEDGPITLTKDITVTVPGSSAIYTQDIENALSKFTAESLKYAAGENKGSVIDKDAVTDNIQLPKPGKLGVDGGRNGYKIVYSVLPDAHNAVDISGYLANVVRPISEEKTTVKLRLTITKQTNGVLNTDFTGYKDIEIKISPITPAEINAELAMLEKVKTNFFEGINDGANISKDAVINNLHSFREAYLDKDGSIVWVYNSEGITDTGIVPADIEGYDPMSTALWRTFRSSDNKIITHETMQVTRPTNENASVTIEANLKSTRLGGYYETYKNDTTYGPIFKRLAGEPVSVTMTVLKQGANPVSVSFSANGGEGEMKNAASYGSLTLPECTFEAPVGREFAGWSLNKDAKPNEAVNAGETVTIDESGAVYYAVWGLIAPEINPGDSSYDEGEVVRVEITHDAFVQPQTNGNGADDTDGVEIFYTVNGGEPEPYAGAFDLTMDEDKILTAWVTDADGNRSKDVTAEYTLKSSEPKKKSSSGTTNYYVVHTYIEGEGTVEPVNEKGNKMVRSGKDQTFTFTPAAGYEIGDIVVNGKSVGAVSTYTVKKIDHDMNIEITFVKNGTSVITSAPSSNPTTGAAI